MTDVPEINYRTGATVKKLWRNLSARWIHFWGQIVSAIHNLILLTMSGAIFRNLTSRRCCRWQSQVISECEKSASSRQEMWFNLWYSLNISMNLTKIQFLKTNAWLLMKMIYLLPTIMNALLHLKLGMDITGLWPQKNKSIICERLNVAVWICRRK